MFLLAENQRNTHNVGSLPVCFVHVRKRRNQVFQETFNRDSKEDPNKKMVQVRADKQRLMLSMLWMKTVLGLICLVEDCGPQNQWSDVKSNPFLKGIHFESASVFLPGLINTGVADTVDSTDKEHNCTVGGLNHNPWFSIEDHSVSIVFNTTVSDKLLCYKTVSSRLTPSHRKSQNPWVVESSCLWAALQRVLPVVTFHWHTQQ